ncbi:thiolase domain-containing protein [Streptomyces mutomycini]|uniref:Thiolase domain-containing protein n=1 Tax=Streptomyces mutomycini TaxID=284036 RepID=A0ABW0AX52_9ACTN|nr:thiolase domain-containing protein [Streptomyces mutomycini]
MTRGHSTPDVVIAGWGHPPFGKHEGTLETLLVTAVRDALAHAGIKASDVDEIVLGNFNAGMNALAFPSSLVLQADDALHGLPVTRVENACASGSAAVHTGIRSILAGTSETVLVVGAEKMTERDSATVGQALLGADYEAAGQVSTSGFAGLFARVADAYAERHGDPSEAMARIAAKSHAQAAKNPLAHLRKPLDFEFCHTVSEKNPLVAGRLRRTDCSPVSDGAAALVLTRGGRMSSAAATRGVAIAAIAHANDYLPGRRRDPLEFHGTAAAWRAAMDAADVGLTDLSFVELHDCFTIAELNLYEVLGIAPEGKGASAIESGLVMPSGNMPVNVSGGLKSKGHPVGATGVSQHVLAGMQLTGTAGELQLPRADRAAVHNMGGLAVANYVSVLEARRT